MMCEGAKKDKLHFKLDPGSVSRIALIPVAHRSQFMHPGFLAAVVVVVVIIAVLLIVVLGL